MTSAQHQAKHPCTLAFQIEAICHYLHRRPCVWSRPRRAICTFTLYSIPSGPSTVWEASMYVGSASHGCCWLRQLDRLLHCVKMEAVQLLLPAPSILHLASVRLCTSRFLVVCCATVRHRQSWTLLHYSFTSFFPSVWGNRPANANARKRGPVSIH